MWDYSTNHPRQPAPAMLIHFSAGATPVPRIKSTPKMEVELKDTLNATWKNDKTGFGFRMMQKMGWKEDKGLGKNESGIVDNVKIQKRETGLGLGSQDITDNANRGWSATATSFNAVLDVLKESFGKKEEKKKAKAKKSAPTVTISVGMK